VILAAARRGKLRGGQIDTDWPRTPPGQPGRKVRGTAAKLDHVQAGHLAEHAKLAFWHVEHTPVISSAAHAPRA